MKINLENIVLSFLASAAIGVGISFGKLYLFHIMLIILFFSVIYIKKGVIKNFFPTNWIDFVPFLLFFWYAFSIFWSISFIYSLKYIFYLFCGISILLVITKYSISITRLNKVYQVLRIVFSVEIIIALLEGLSLFRWPISPFSSYVSFFGRNMAIYEDTVQTSIDYLMTMPTGFHWNPNNLAVLMVILFPFSLISINIKNKLIGIIFTLSIIVMTGSRGTFLALLFMLFVYFIFYEKRWVLSILILSLSIVIFFFLVNYTSIQKIHEIANSLEALKIYLFENVQSSGGSLGVRQKLITIGLEGFKNTHGIGFGAGGSVAYIESLGGVGVHKVSSIHNFWVEMLIEGGIIIFLIFVFWYVNIFRKLFIIYSHSKNEALKYFSGALSLSLVGFTIAAVSASSVIYFLPMWIMFGMCISVVRINTTDN
jgi:teichuronic acid biosynthesis protein TuaE